MFALSLPHTLKWGWASSCRNTLVRYRRDTVHNAPIIDCRILRITFYHYIPLLVAACKTRSPRYRRRNYERRIVYAVCSANNFHAQRHDFFTVCVLGLCTLHNISWINCAPAPKRWRRRQRQKSSYDKSWPMCLPHANKTEDSTKNVFPHSC